MSKKGDEIVRVNFEMKRRLWEQFTGMCRFRGQDVHEVLYILIEQWLTKVGSIKKELFDNDGDEEKG